MNKTVKRIILIALALVLVVFGAFRLLQGQTKKYSPEVTLNFSEGDLNMIVFYNRPYKKGREIFGGLVPYDKVWRTGANEATTFETNKDLRIGQQTLKAGKYTLWTIPNPESWEVIFNDQMYGWGVDFNEQASRKPEFDVVNYIAPVKGTGAELEQFSIDVEFGDPTLLVLAWDRTRVEVPMVVQ